MGTKLADHQILIQWLFFYQATSVSYLNCAFLFVHFGRVCFYTIDILHIHMKFPSGKSFFDIFEQSFNRLEDMINHQIFLKKN